VYTQLVSAVNDPGPTGHGLTALATARDLMFTKTGMDPVTGALGATSGYFQELYAEVGDNAASITTIEQVNVSQGSAISALDTSLTGLIDITIPSLQSQIDGVIDTWFYDGEPTILNAPANTWMDDTVKANHVGDLYYDKVTGYGYRFAYEDIVDTPDMGVIFTWIRISDVDVVLALSNAATAQETADGKASVYYGTTAPTLTVDDVGDVFVNSSTKVTQVWNGTVWVNATTVDANTALAKLVDLEEARDGVVDTFYVTTAPLSGMSYGDYWVDTDSWTGTVYIVYRYEALDGSSTGTLAWRVNTGETAVTLGKAYRADVLAGTAQGTADGKVKTWYQASAPTGLTTADIGDIWVDTDAGNVTKTWSGSAWVDITNTKTDTAYTWSAEASKLITSPVGAITGWSFGDGTNTSSFFKISADKFSLVNANGTATPLVVNAADPNNVQMTFNGTVDFTNTNMSSYDNSNVDLSGLATSTLSNVTTIDGGKITTNSIVASKINTAGLIAENISTTNLYGISIEGARITGSVIKASYLDLDGELEVLTNYHITPAMYTENPSLYTDAVYLSAADEYRIPTASSVSSYSSAVTVAKTSTLASGTDVNTTIGTISNSGIFPYNCGNIGHNIKAVKEIPSSLGIGSSKILFGQVGSRDLSNGTWSSVAFEILLGDTVIFTVSFQRYYVGSSQYYISVTLNGVTVNPPSDESPRLASKTTSVAGVTCEATASVPAGFPVSSPQFYITLNKDTSTPLTIPYASAEGKAISIRRVSGALPLGYTVDFSGTLVRINSEFLTVASALNNMI